jgi:pimeloyl-ACP methyl ester carboxylesterase
MKGELMDSTTGFFNGLYYEIAGEGQPLVLIHGGLVNSGLWDDQFEVFATQYRTLRYDVRGFGKSKSPASYYSNHGDLRDLLEYLGIERACVLGLSMGGMIAIDFTLAYPDHVAALLPIAAGLSGYHATSHRALRDEMNAAYERGDKERAVELSLQVWTDGPHRTPDRVDPAVRERIRAMTMHTFNLPDVEQWLQRLEPPAIDRLAEIHAPTLFVVGDQDVEDILTIGDLIVTHVPGARRAIIPGAAHHLNMEQPAEFNRSVLEFLDSLTR